MGQIERRQVPKDVVTLDEPPPLESPPTSRKHSGYPTQGSSPEANPMESGNSSVPPSENIHKTIQSSSSFSDTVSQRVNSSASATVTSHLKHKYDESLESSNFRPVKFEGAKTISIEESVQLIEAQRHKQEVRV